MRFRTKTPVSDTWHSFSFGDHYDPDNVGFGALVVNNTDRVPVGLGYGDHPHADAEIVTWVLSGSLVHLDSTGHRGVVHRGRIQALTAGSGIVHAERNDAFSFDPSQAIEPARFVQMWIRPDESGVVPAYRSSEVDLGELDRDWLPVASGGSPDAAVTIGSRESTLWVTTLGAGRTRRLPTAARAHVQLVRGQVDIEAVGHLDHGDAARLAGETARTVTAVSDAELLVWTLPR